MAKREHAIADDEFEQAGGITLALQNAFRVTQSKS